MSELKTLTREDCQVLRGLAIMSIFIHNYCHLLPNAAHENEFFFSKENFAFFLERAFSQEIFVQVFSFLGHLGVPVFVFLTGFGLAQKYTNSSIDISMNIFICNHYKKFFFPMLLGMSIYMFVIYIQNGELWIDWWKTLIAQMTLTNNLVLHPVRLIRPGVYWYFGMTMQLYVIYRLIVYRHSLSLLTLLTILSLILLMSLETKHNMLIWVKYNAVGWLIPFAMGILLSKIRRITIHSSQWLCIFVLSFALLLLLGSNYYLWLIIPIVSIAFYISLCKLLRGYVYSFFFFIGNISLYIFVIHPIVREIVFYNTPSEFRYLGIAIYIVLVVTCSWSVHKLLHLRQKLQKEKLK